MPSDSSPPSSPENQPPDDDDLARIPPTVRRRSPIVALAVLALAGLLLFRLRDDTRFALASRTPRELGEARALKVGDLADNSFVAIRGLPDRRNALLFEPKGDSYRRAFFRLLGTDTRILVRADQTTTRHQLDDRFVGRLRRFDAIPWAEQIRAYYRKLPVTRLLDLAVLRHHLGDPKVPLVDRAGDAAPSSPDTEVGIETDFPEDLKISLSKKQFAVEEDARHDAERLGAPLALYKVTSEGYIYVVRVPAKERDAYLKKLEERGFPFAARRERFTARMGDLALDRAADALTFAARADNPVEYDVQGAALAARPAGARSSLPWARVASVQFAAPVVIPGDAFLVLENETPSDDTWVLAVDGLLGLFVLFNLLMLARSLRRPAAA